MLETLKLPKFPLSLSISVDWSFDPSYNVTTSELVSVYEVGKFDFMFIEL